MQESVLTLLKNLLYGIIFTSLLLSAGAVAKVVVPESSFTIDLATEIDYLEDPTHQLTVTDASSSDRWQRNKKSPINYGISDTVWWFRVKLSNPLSMDREVFVDLNSVFLDHFEATLLDDNEQRLHRYVTGDKLPFTSRPLPTRTFVFPLLLPAQTTTTLFLRVQHKGSVTLPLLLSDENSFWLRERQAGWVSGAFFGVMLIMLFYNLVLLLFSRESGYFYYIVYIAVFILVQACHTGYAYQYLWPSSPTINEMVLKFTTGLVIITALRFNAEILSLKTKALILWQISIFAIAILSLICLWLTFTSSYIMAIKLYSLSALCAVGYIYISGLYFVLQKNRIAIYYMIAWTPILLAFTNYALNRFNISPLSTDPLQLFKLAIGLEAVLFSLILAARIQQEREIRLSTQKQFNDLQQSSNKELEQQVKQRTKELQVALQKLDKLSTIDPLTGIRMG